jgi:diacylglycerol kinase family enzyme
VMGGDGSLGCLIDDLILDPVVEKGISRLVFAPLSYGTGNDLSRSLGWGNTEGPWGKNIETLVTALLNAEREQFTVWDINIHAS